MSEGFGGSYPGGPSRDDPDGPERRRGHARPESVEDWTRKRDDARRHRTFQKRKRRLVVGLLVSLVLAGVVGYVLGRSAHRSGADLARETESGGSVGIDSRIQEERQRVIQELWRMEIWEHSGGGG